MAKKIPKQMPIIAPEEKPAVWLLCGHIVQNEGSVSSTIGVVGETI